MDMEVEVDNNSPGPSPMEVMDTSPIDTSETAAQKMCISALALFRGTLFKAEGSLLSYKKFEKVMDMTAKVHVVKVFPRQIHISYLKFEVSENRESFLLVASRPETRIFKIIDEENDEGVFRFTEIPPVIHNWIVASQWLNDPADALVTLTDENTAVIWKLNHKPDEWIEGKPFRCDKSQIIAATMHGKNLDELLIFSGTLDSSTIVWKITQDGVKILYRLAAQKGTIFSVNFYPEQGLLLVTSDDRSVVPWQFSNTIDKHKHLSIVEAIHQNVATHAVKFQCFGHKGRVLHSMFAGGKIFSCGEDRNLCTWSLDGILLRKWDAHRGSPVWSCVNDHKTRIVFTGAKNGSLAQSFLDTENPKAEKLVLEYPRIVNQAHLAEYSDFPRAMFVYNEKHTLVHMTSGSILVAGVGGEPNYTLYNHTSGLSQSECCLTTDKKYLLFGVRSTLHILKLKLRDDDDVMSAHVQMDGNKVEVKAADLIISMFPLGYNSVFISEKNTQQVFTIMGSSDEASFNLEDVEWNSDTPLPTVTAVLDTEKLLLIGDHKGRIHVLSITPKKLLYTIPPFHGADPVSCLGFIRDNIMASYADSCVKFLDFDVDLKKCDLLRSVHLPFQSVISMFQYGTDTILLGFKATDVVMYSMERGTLLSIACGGAHRSWSFGSANVVSSFAFIRDKAVYQSNFSIKEYYKDVMHGTHLATINCGVEVHKYGEKIYIATGSEDNHIHISSMDFASEGEKYVLEAVVGAHHSSVRAIAYEKITEESGFLISGGGKSLLCLSTLDFKDGEVSFRQHKIIDVMLIPYGWRFSSPSSLALQSSADIRVMDIATMLRPPEEWLYNVNRISSPEQESRKSDRNESGHNVEGQSKPCDSGSDKKECAKFKAVGQYCGIHDYITEPSELESESDRQEPGENDPIELVRGERGIDEPQFPDLIRSQGSGYTRPREFDSGYRGHFLYIFAACSNGTVRIFRARATTVKPSDLHLYGVCLPAGKEDEDEECPSAIQRVRILESENRDVQTVFGVTSNGCLILWNTIIEEKIESGDTPKLEILPPSPGLEPTSPLADASAQTGSTPSPGHSSPEASPPGPPDPTETVELLNEHRPVQKYRSVHACAITSLEVFRKNDTEVFVVTGGDDGVIKVHKVSVKPYLPEIPLLWKVESIHRSTIMSIEKCNANEFFAASVDQVFTKWNLAGTKLVETYTGVTDCQVLISTQSGRKIVCGGDGISVVSLP